MMGRFDWTWLINAGASALRLELSLHLLAVPKREEKNVRSAM